MRCRPALLQKAWTMPNSRPRKKARSAKKSAGPAKAKPVETIGKNGSSENPHLSTELIARVATYVPLLRLDDEIGRATHTKYLYNDLHNLCLAAGPESSRSIKQSCLKKNMNYIEHCQSLFRTSSLTGQKKFADWSKEGHLAWMSANRNWREYVTDDVIEHCRYTPPLGDDSHLSWRQLIARETSDITDHALSGFANPARAIQLGLVDALRFLVEDKLIDVNAKQWKTFKRGDDPTHLLTVAIHANQPEAFDYLLSLEAIDFNGDSTELDRYTKYIFTSALEAYVEDENNGHFFRALVQHPKFQPNGRVIYGYNPDQRAPGKMTLLHMFVNEYTCMLMGYYRPEVVKEKQKRFLHALKLVLDAGADPKLEFDDLRSPHAIALDNLGATSCGGISFGQRLVHTLQEMNKMMLGISKQSQK